MYSKFLVAIIVAAISIGAVTTHAQNNSELEALVARVNGQTKVAQEEMEEFKALGVECLPLLAEMVKSNTPGRNFGLLALKYGELESELSPKERENIVTILIENANTEGYSGTELDILAFRHVPHPKALEFVRSFLKHDVEYIRDAAQKVVDQLSAKTDRGTTPSTNSPESAVSRNGAALPTPSGSSSLRDQEQTYSPLLLVGGGLLVVILLSVFALSKRSNSK